MNYSIIPREEFERVRNCAADKFKMLELYADLCRYNTLLEVKKAGSGHLGSSFSAMEIIVYLYLCEMNVLEKGFDSEDRDIYFSSKGHDVPGLYSLFYALGIVSEERFLKLRRLNGLDGHPDVRIRGIEANTGSLGMGIAKGKGMAWAKKYKGSGGRIFVLTGDGEFQEGQIFESLQVTAHQKINNITVIIDRNKFQTDMLVNDVNSIEVLAEKVSSFGWNVFKCNGNDFRSIEAALSEAKRIEDKPKFIIADTIKGKGVSFMEEPVISKDGKKMYAWHSGAPNDTYFVKAAEEIKERILEKCGKLGIEPVFFRKSNDDAKPPSSVSTEYVKIAYGEALCEIAEKRKDLIVLDGDLAADCGLRPFEEKYPGRFIENGIAEQDMVSTAGGMARAGLLPVVNTFASFLAARANEQIYNNACENTKIIYTCHFAGLMPAGPGKSHQSVRDISLFGAMPNFTIVQPCNAPETKMLLDYCVNQSRENCVLRLVIGPSPRMIKLPGDYILSEGRGVRIKEGKDALIFAYGPVMLNEALTASELLEESGFSLAVINMPWLNKVDKGWFLETVEPYRRIFVLEDHSVFGGLGDKFTEILALTGFQDNRTLIKFGLEEYPECGTPLEVLKYHRLDGKSLAERISGISLNDVGEDKNTYSSDAPQ